MTALPMYEGPGRALYFLHIPKTAGTSVIELLDRQFAPQTVLPAQLIPALEESPAITRTTARLIRGHLGARLHEILDQPLTTFTILRDPVERTLSHFAHVRREPGHYLHSRVDGAHYGIADFLSDPDCRRLIANHQARHVVRSLRDPPLVVGSFPGHPLARQIAFELAPLPPTDALRSSALAALSGIDVVGMADELDRSLDRLGQRMGWPRLAKAPKRREGLNRLSVSDLSPAVRDEILELTAVDGDLIAAARKSLRVPIKEPATWWWDPARDSDDTRGWHPVRNHEVHGWHRWSRPGTPAVARLDGRRERPGQAIVIEIEVVAAAHPSFLSGTRGHLNGIPLELAPSPGANGGCRLLATLARSPTPPFEIRLTGPSPVSPVGPDPAVGIAVRSIQIRPINAEPRDHGHERRRSTPMHRLGAQLARIGSVRPRSKGKAAQPTPRAGG